MNLPVNEEAEAALVGGLLMGSGRPADIAEVYSKIPPSAFSSIRISVVYDACRSLYNARTEVDLITVTDAMKTSGELEKVGGASYVSEIQDKAGSGANLSHWAQTVDEYHRRRQLVRVSQAAAAQASNREQPVRATLDFLNDQLVRIASSRDDLAVELLPDLLRAEFSALELASTSDVDPAIKTGFSDLDEMSGGLVPSELTILAGRPAMGKTALALAFARNVAEAGDQVLVFSLEMSKRSLIHRLIAMQSGVSNQKLRRPRLFRDGDWPRLANAMGALNLRKLAIVDSPSLTVMDIRAASRLCQGKYGLGLIIVDYLQLIRPVEKGHSREREVAEISANLKAIAKEMHVPVVCLAQLNRMSETDKSKVPRLSNLRESGSLEQDADIVLFVHRPHYYDAKEEKELAEIFIAKHRNGPTGKVEIGWNDERTLFFNRERRAEEVGGQTRLPMGGRDWKEAAAGLESSNAEA